MELISKYRTHLMGLAIIWVMLFHLILAQNPTPYSFGPLDSIFGNGYGGVDIFLYLSGFGLVRSWKNCQQNNINKSLLTFYKKRLIRLLPVYVTICIFFSWYKGSFETLFYSASTIGHWVNHQRYDWYVPTMLLFYLLFPLFYKYVVKYKIVFVVLMLFISIFGSIYFIFNAHSDDIRMLSASRVPIFILGIYHGVCLKDHFNNTQRIFSIILMFAGLILLFALKNMNFSYPFCSGINQLPFFLIVPGLCYMVSWILDKINLSLLNKLICFFGVLSYEFYLIHLKLIEGIASLPCYESVNKWCYLIILFTLIILSALMLNNIVNKFLKIIKIK